MCKYQHYIYILYTCCEDHIGLCMAIEGLGYYLLIKHCPKHTGWGIYSGIVDTCELLFLHLPKLNPFIIIQYVKGSSFGVG